MLAHPDSVSWPDRRILVDKTPRVAVVHREAIAIRRYAGVLLPGGQSIELAPG